MFWSSGTETIAWPRADLDEVVELAPSIGKSWRDFSAQAPPDCSSKAADYPVLRCDARHIGLDLLLLPVIVTTGTVRHAHKKRVLNPRADSPTRIAVRGFDVHVRLDWHFGLRPSRTHRLLIGARQFGRGCARVLGIYPPAI
jgi:hypothetical protein